YIFLYGPLKHLQLGVAGVAISTVASRTIALVVSVLIFYRYRVGKIALNLLRPFPKKMLFRMLKIGIPSAGENMAYSFYQLVLLSFINPMGAMAVNAKLYCNTLMPVSVVFSNSLAQATQIVTGHLVGAGREDAADKRVMKTLYTSLPVAIGIAALNCLLCPLTLKLFTENTEVVPLVQQTLAVVIIMEIGRTINLVVLGSMKAAGDVLFPVVVGMLSMWGIGIGVGYGCGIGLSLGMTGVFIGTAADECARGVLALIRWRRGKWKGKAVVKGETA
ncbi:MAG: MATE family efflux transporter, partial [Lachnospiraceae bacterium]